MKTRVEKNNRIVPVACASDVRRETGVVILRHACKGPADGGSGLASGGVDQPQDPANACQESADKCSRYS